jgi:macrolide-specific efflux system membrane fusion protein
LTVSVDGSGNIAVSEDANLTFGTEGEVERVYVEEGDVVWQGRVLVTLDTSALELALTEAEVAVEQAEASLEQAQADKV